MLNIFTNFWRGCEIVNGSALSISAENLAKIIYCNDVKDLHYPDDEDRNEERITRSLGCVSYQIQTCAKMCIASKAFLPGLLLFGKIRQTVKILTLDARLTYST